MNLDWPPTTDAESGEEYHRYVEFYDLFFNDLADDADFYLRLASAQPGCTVLEAGVGTGRLAGKLLRAGHSVIGVDRSEEMLARARARLDEFLREKERCHLVQADLRGMTLGRTADLAVAPYGMVAHLLSDEDRREAYRAIRDHLAPGGRFVFDDMPGWLLPPCDGTRLEVWKTARDPRSGQPMRLMVNWMDTSDGPFSVRYDIVDWLQGEKVARRVIVRVVFRNIALEEELRLLREAGFARVELLGGFDGRPFDHGNPSANSRLIVVCSRE